MMDAPLTRRKPSSRRAAWLLSPLLLPAAQAHPLAAAAPAGPALPWSFEPWVVACLLASALLYALGLRRLWAHAGRGRGIGAAALAAFAAGWLTLALALVSPLDALAARLFAAHMLQHELLMMLAAPLLVLGRPLVAWTWALPPAARRAAGACTRHPAFRRPWRAITSPAGAGLLHALALWAWHVPALFDAALANEGVHALQHASFLGTALLFWWSVLGSAGRDRAADGLALASLLATMLHTGALGALLTVAASPWYPGYAGLGAAFGLGALEDQQLGGVVMWVPAGFGYLAAAVWLGARLLAPAPRAGLAALRREA